MHSSSTTAAVVGDSSNLVFVVKTQLPNELISSKEYELDESLKGLLDLLESCDSPLSHLNISDDYISFISGLRAIHITIKGDSKTRKQVITTLKNSGLLRVN